MLTKPPRKTSDDKEFMATLAKGLAVLGCFGKQHPTLTLSQAAAAANLSRATARRILRTLAELGYVEQQGRDFALSPNILNTVPSASTNSAASSGESHAVAHTKASPRAPSDINR